MQATNGRSAPDHVSASKISLPARATLTKRHFIAIAKVLADYKSQGNEDDVARRCIARDLASYFSTQNALFDRSRFLSAAMVED
jgi:hypothetical protein